MSDKIAAARPFLVELGTEELPPKALAALSQAFAEGVATGLTRRGIAHVAARPYASPRRLAVLVEAVAARQPDQNALRKGPALATAFAPDGTPTRAAEGFARSVGTTVAALERLTTPEGAWLSYRTHTPGQATPDLLAEIVEEALKALPIPKRMRWGAGEAAFVRPVHTVLLLWGAEVVPARILGVESGRRTRGHRFHHPAEIEIRHPDDYEARLRAGHVWADLPSRRAEVAAQIARLAAAAGGVALAPAALVDEVTALVEWPVAYLGQIHERFLALPPAVLFATLMGHQRYFPVLTAAGQPLPAFVFVANLDSLAPEEVRAGNERVVVPRLADAEFFLRRDRAAPLFSRLERLGEMVFEKTLGSYLDKTRRVAALARQIASAMGMDPTRAERAALLSRCDLLTEMVGEFPDLQGTMGRHYALADGEDAEVALAIEEMYAPRQAGAALPVTPTGQALALADRLDTLVGIFGVGHVPTGEKDPFGLRRTALGVLRPLLEGGVDLDLDILLREAAAPFAPLFSVERVTAEVHEFIIERLRGYLLDRGTTPDCFEAVRARRPTHPRDFRARVEAVAAFRLLPEAEALAAANKRIGNILRQAGAAAEGGEVAEGLLVEPAERRLAAEIDALAAEVMALITGRDYSAALHRLATLRPAVDTFFDDVMVLCEDAALRRNRLALLARLQGLFLGIADLSRLQG
jgi:glycyl-tRNA synthetase beta chain